MTRYVVHLTGKDWAKASPGDPHACLLAQGLNRQLGGHWGVAGHHATEFNRDGETIKRQLRLGSDAKSIMRWFDWLGVKTGRKATFHGKFSKQELRTICGPDPAKERKRKTSLSPGQKGAAGTAATGGLLVVTGFWWVDAIAAAIAAIGMGGTIAVRRGWISIPRPAPGPARVSKPELPTLAALRGMTPHQRQQALGRAVAAPEPVTTAPEPVAQPSTPVAAPRPPRPSWPVPAPRVVEPVSHRSAIPDYVPENMPQRAQARAEDRS
jgi:hypothetical protein